MTGWHDCTGFQRDLLKAIADHDHYDREPYGLALRDWLEATYDEEINHSRLYQNLDQLEARGLVAKTSLDERTNAYELTDTAEDCILTQAQSFANVVGHDLLATDGGDV